MNQEELVGRYPEQLQEQLDCLKEDGWDYRSIKAYLSVIESDAAAFDADVEGLLVEYWHDVHQVGSPLFTHMFLTGFYRSSISATNRLAMFYNILGFERDDTNFVQLRRLGDDQEENLYHLSITSIDELADYIIFIDVMTRMMRLKYRSWQGFASGKYAKSDLLTDAFDNQLRYYLGKPIIEFIQSVGWSQEEYEATLYAIMGDLPRYPDAYLHNRGLTLAVNHKVVTPDYHIEVIFDQNGKLVSMWNALGAHDMVQPDGSIRFDTNVDHYTEAELQEIANTESLNYANKGGIIHNKLDVMPANRHAGLESDLRNSAKALFD